MKKDYTYKDHFLLTQSYQLVDNQKWVAKGHIKPVKENVGRSYAWDKNHFDTEDEANSYAFAQMIIIIEKGNFMTIGDLAKETGEKVYNIRFWVQEGLLEETGKTIGGVQLFTNDAVRRMKKIRLLKDVGHLTLDGIKRELENE